MINFELTDEDRKAIEILLLGYKSAGVAVPLLPMDVDVDGDGIVDAFGLDEAGNVIVVTGVSLEHTVYVAEGEED